MSTQNTRYLSRTTAPKYFSDVQIRAFHDPNARHHPGSHSSTLLRTVAWNNLGSRIATGGGGGNVKIWNPEKADVRSSTDLKGTGLQVTERVQWDPTHAERLASCGVGDSGVDVAAKATQDIKTGADNFSLSYHPEAYAVAVGRKDNKVKLLDLRQNAVFHTIDGGNDPVFQTTFSHNGTLLLQTHVSGKVVLRAYPSLEPVHSFAAHTAGCYCLDLSPSGRYIATGGNDALISLWDTTDWVCVRTFDKADHPIRSVSFSFDGAFLVAGSDESMPLDIAHVDTGDYVHEIKTGYPAHAVAWHPSKYVIAYTGEVLRVTGVGSFT
ncbi:hypothetical protein DRE_02166 [Drechslerella stenobrocha 248]|uniref:Uncharacterized protein n=1 Tax=Drechslerella stenobrocha 248 TaxID=1043628 RepID=W7I8J5_9PEZI|nr:hypothetical protein DRE_02166 [Drechslerella stenobrocha 248]